MQFIEKSIEKYKNVLGKKESSHFFKQKFTDTILFQTFRPLRATALRRQHYLHL